MYEQTTFTTAPHDKKNNLSASRQALLEKKLQGKAAGDSSHAGIPQKPPGPAPLSFSQQRLWFLKQLETGSIAYNVPTAIRLRGILNIPVLTQAINEVVRRHKILRATFEIDDGEVIQKIAPELQVTIGIEDLSHLSEADKASAIIYRAREDGAHVFDLNDGPLLRVNLLTLATQEYVLLFTIHHIVFDGWSAAILFEEFATLYSALLENRTASLPQLPLQYTDFAYWQRQWLQGERLEKQLRYWRNQLDNAPALLELPTDFPRPPIQSGRGALYSFRIPKNTADGLNALSRKQGVTLFVTLISAFNVLLHRYSGQNDFCLGASVANRNRPELEALIGLFANILILRADFSGNPRFTEFMRRMQTVALDAQQHQDLPLDKLLEELNPPRDRSYNPYFQSIFILHNMPIRKWEIADLAISNMRIDFGTAKSDIDLHITENDEGFAAEFEYSTDLFEASTIKNMAAHFHTLLTGIIEQPESRADAIPLLAQSEYRQLLFWSQAQKVRTGNGLLHERFETFAKTQPQHPAVACGERKLSYGELNRLAEQLAQQLRAHGVGMEVRVGLCAERSVDAIVGMLAILKANGVYVPLDPSAPPERIGEVLSDCEPALLLTQQRWEERLPRGITLLYLDGDGRLGNNTTDKSAITQYDYPASALHSAYLIYTSGSAGVPKGVLVSHANAAASTGARFATYPDPPENFLLLSSFAFDSSIAGIFWTLSHGGQLLIAPESQHKDPKALTTIIARERPTHLLSLPSFYALLLDTLETVKPDRLRCVIVAGEVCPPALVERHYERLPDTRLYNEYGPTEATVWSSVYPIRADDARDDRTVSIGRPIAGSQLFILDSRLNLAPIGVPGEIYLGGNGIARAYHRRPEASADKFVPNPFADNGSRLYRTGDLARWRPDGNIEFLGRADDQVKIRGFRIELREIEARLLRHPHVMETAGVVHPDTAGDRRIVAYIVSNDATEPDHLRMFLKKTLPDYMIPNAFVFMERLPVTPNGKLDRGALPAPHFDTQHYAAPQTLLEEQLTEIWTEVFKLERIGIHDNFFELGGHSLTAIQIIARIEGKLDVEISVAEVFDAPTISELAQCVMQHQNEDDFMNDEMLAILKELEKLPLEEAIRLLENPAH